MAAIKKFVLNNKLKLIGNFRKHSCYGENFDAHKHYNGFWRDSVSGLRALNIPGFARAGRRDG